MPPDQQHRTSETLMLWGYLILVYGGFLAIAALVFWACWTFAGV